MKITAPRHLLAALLAATPLAALRADPGASAPAAASAPSKSPSTITLDFPGGTLGELIAMIQKTGGEPALNVIGEKAALATQVQAFTVQNADRDTILGAVGQLLRGTGVRVEPVGRGVFIVSLDRNSPPLIGAERALLDSLGGRDRRPTRPPEAMFDSFPLNGLVDEQQSVDTIVDVIRSAWTLNPAHDANALAIKYHTATKLLLVSGPPEAIEMTREVIRSLHDNRRTRKDPPENR